LVWTRMHRRGTARETDIKRSRGLVFRKKIWCSTAANQSGLQPLTKKEDRPHLQVHQITFLLLRVGSILFFVRGCKHSDLQQCCTNFFFQFLDKSIVIGDGQVGRIRERILWTSLEAKILEEIIWLKLNTLCYCDSQTSLRMDFFLSQSRWKRPRRS
jgi:hypothetical protein